MWGLLLFGERITLGKVLGAVFVICGIVLYAINDGEDVNNAVVEAKSEGANEGGAE